jgi:hypothetical protein
MNRYSHAYAICFTLENFDRTGESPSPAQLRSAIQQRLASLTDVELVEVVGLPHDTSKVPPIVQTLNVRRSHAYATSHDMDIIRQQVSDSELCEALDNAPPGIITQDAWVRWHLALGRTQVPPLPKRRFDDASSSRDR